MSSRSVNLHEHWSRAVNDLIEFLTRCNDEDEAAAEAASLAAYSSWQVDSGYVLVADNDGWTYCLTGYEKTSGAVLDSMTLGAVVCEEPAEHIALHDPARVLRECAARRWLIEGYRRAVSHEDPHEHDCRSAAYAGALLLSAQSYADHPDFRDEWRIQ